MSLPLNQLNLGAVTQPYIHTRPFALFLWLLINLASFGFEFKQWRQRRAEATKRDRGSFALLMTGTAAGLFLLVSAPALEPAAAIRPPGAAFAVGMALFVGGFGMRRWSEMTLGRYFTFTVMTSAEQPVITSGPYRFVRHPGYTGVLLILLGSGLVTGNWIGLAGWTLLVMVPLLYRIHVEEHALLSAVGDRYRTYATGHKRLIPLVW
jgi:protein-S-isoprenylcysteine O-methyltransferase Ste14